MPWFSFAWAARRANECTKEDQNAVIQHFRHMQTIKIHKSALGFLLFGCFSVYLLDFHVCYACRLETRLDCVSHTRTEHFERNTFVYLFAHTLLILYVPCIFLIPIPLAFWPFWLCEPNKFGILILEKKNNKRKKKRTHTQKNQIKTNVFILF